MGYSFPLICLVAGLALGACTTSEAVPAAEANPAKPKDPTLDRTLDRTLDLTSFIDVQSTPNNEKNNLANKCVVALTDLYVRFIIEAKKTNNSSGSDKVVGRRYDTEARGWLARALVGRTISHVLSAKLRTSDGSIQATVPLASLNHDSKSEVGEVFATDLVDTAVPTPFFRISPETRITTDIEFSRSETYDSQAIAIALRVARESVKLFAPGADLATSLSRPHMEREARAFDAAIGQLFSETIRERVLRTGPVSDWYKAGKVHVALVLALPSDSPRRNIGEWTINISSPRVSIFSMYEAPVSTDCVDRTKMTMRLTALNAASAFAGVQPAQILSFRLTDQVLLGDFLRRQSWYLEGATATINAANPKGAANLDAVAGFCSSVVAILYAAGLNEFDAHAGLWATLRSLPSQGDPLAASSRVRRASSCGKAATVMDQLGLK